MSQSEKKSQVDVLMSQLNMHFFGRTETQGGSEELRARLATLRAELVSLTRKLAENEEVRTVPITELGIESFTTMFPWFSVNSLECLKENESSNIRWRLKTEGQPFVVIDGRAMGRTTAPIYNGAALYVSLPIYCMAGVFRNRGTFTGYNNGLVTCFDKNSVELLINSGFIPKVPPLALFDAESLTREATMFDASCEPVQMGPHSPGTWIPLDEALRIREELMAAASVSATTGPASQDASAKVSAKIKRSKPGTKIRRAPAEAEVSTNTVEVVDPLTDPSLTLLIRSRFKDLPSNCGLFGTTTEMNISERSTNLFAYHKGEDLECFLDVTALMPSLMKNSTVFVPMEGARGSSGLNSSCFSGSHPHASNGRQSFTEICFGNNTFKNDLQQGIATSSKFASFLYGMLSWLSQITNNDCYGNAVLRGIEHVGFDSGMHMRPMKRLVHLALVYTEAMAHLTTIGEIFESVIAAKNTSYTTGSLLRTQILCSPRTHEKTAHLLAHHGVTLDDFSAEQRVQYNHAIDGLVSLMQIILSVRFCVVPKTSAREEPSAIYDFVRMPTEESLVSGDVLRVPFIVSGNQRPVNTWALSLLFAQAGMLSTITEYLGRPLPAHADKDAVSAMLHSLFDPESTLERSEDAQATARSGNIDVLKRLFNFIFMMRNVTLAQSVFGTSTPLGSREYSTNLFIADILAPTMLNVHTLASGYGLSLDRWADATYSFANFSEGFSTLRDMITEQAWGTRYERVFAMRNAYHHKNDAPKDKKSEAGASDTASRPVIRHG